MKSTRTAVLELAAAIAWKHRDAPLLLATLKLGLRVPPAHTDLEDRRGWPLGAKLLLRAYH